MAIDEMPNGETMTEGRISYGHVVTVTGMTPFSGLTYPR